MGKVVDITIGGEVAGTVSSYFYPLTVVVAFNIWQQHIKVLGLTGVFVCCSGGITVRDIIESVDLYGEVGKGWGICSPIWGGEFHGLGVGF